MKEVKEKKEKTRYEELYAFRMKAIRDAIAWKKPAKTPLFSNVYNWAFLDAGYSLAEAAGDYRKLMECQRHFLDQYQVDLVSGPGLRNPVRVTEALGKNNLYVLADGDGDSLNVLAKDLIQAEDYDEIIRGNFQKVLWERCLSVKYPGVGEMSAEQIALAVREMVDYNTVSEELRRMMREEYGVLQFTNQFFLTTFFEQLFSKYRPIKSIALDIRRRPNKVEEACEVMTRPLLEKALSLIKNGTEGPDYNYTSELFSTITGHTILNNKDFEKYYMKYWGPALEACEETGKCMMFFSEGDWGRLGDYFNEYKKGTVAMMVETEDIYQIRKAYPNICLIGGLDVDVMGQKSPQECIDMAKRAIDELGTDGGLILQPNKMVTYKNDMKSENLRAVADFVAEYK